MHAARLSSRFQFPRTYRIWTRLAHEIVKLSLKGGQKVQACLGHEVWGDDRDGWLVRGASRPADNEVDGKDEVEPLDPPHVDVVKRQRRVYFRHGVAEG